MSHLPVPRHLHVPHHVPGPPAGLVQAFWTLTIATLLMVVAFVVMGSIDPIQAPIVGVLLVTLTVLWALHVRATHAHHDEIERDIAFRKARERRGF